MASRDSVRAAFAAAAEQFVATTGLVPNESWEQPALGEWSIRSLVGHTSRALLTVETYLSSGAEAIDIRDSVEYWIRAIPVIAGDSAIAERGRQAGIALGEDPAEAVRVIAARVLPKVEQAPDHALVGTPWGGMKLIDYLPTRIFELVIHTIDLAAALGRESTVSDAASEMTWELIRALARRSGREQGLLLAVTGRAGLPPGFSVLKS